MGNGIKGSEVTREKLREMIERARNQKGGTKETRPGNEGHGFTFAIKGNRLVIEVDLESVVPNQEATYIKRNKKGEEVEHVRSSITIAQTPSNAFGAGGQDVQLPKGKKGGFALRVWEKV